VCVCVCVFVFVCLCVCRELTVHKELLGKMGKGDQRCVLLFRSPPALDSIWVKYKFYLSLSLILFMVRLKADLFLPRVTEV